MTSSVIGLLLLSSALAQDAQYTQLEAGEQAPFAGYLFNETATAELIVEKQFIMTECDLRVEYEIKKTQAEMNLQIETLQISWEALSEKHNLLMDIKNNKINTYREMALDQPNKNNHWWLAGGVVVGIGLSLGTFYAATEISK